MKTRWQSVSFLTWNAWQGWNWRWENAVECTASFNLTKLTSSVRGLRVPASGRGMLCNLCLTGFSMAGWSNPSPEKAAAFPSFSCAHSRGEAAVQEQGSFSGSLRKRMCKFRAQNCSLEWVMSYEFCYSTVCPSFACNEQISVTNENGRFKVQRKYDFKIVCI